eukprot:1160193-Pelagomonas_calceolata.AAC.3
MPHVRKGDSLTISYGDCSNESLLLRYGFVLPDNPLGFAMPFQQNAVRLVSALPQLKPEEGLAILMAGPIIAATQWQWSDDKSSMAIQKPHELIHMHEFVSPLSPPVLHALASMLQQQSKLSLLEDVYALDKIAGLMCNWHALSLKEHKVRTPGVSLQ